MKYLVITLLAVMLALSAAIASAETALLPEGANVHAVVSGATATITITGVKPANVEFYSYEGVKNLGAVSTFTINLREGRRFNLTFGSPAKYSLLTADMANFPTGTSGAISIDCSDPRGCAYIVTK